MSFKSELLFDFYNFCFVNDTKNSKIVVVFCTVIQQINRIQGKKKMDDKLNQALMEEHLSNTKWDIKAALQRFEDTGIKIDRRFQRDFIKQTTDW